MSSNPYEYSIDGWDASDESDAPSPPDANNEERSSKVASTLAPASSSSVAAASTAPAKTPILAGTKTAEEASPVTPSFSYLPPTPTNTTTANMEETARQHYIIGDNLRHKGFYDDSIVEFQKSLDIRSRLLGEWHLETGKTYYALGLSQRALKDYPAALLHLTKAAQTLEHDDNIASDAKVDENRKAMLVQVQCNIARTHHTQAVDLQRVGRYDASIQEHRKALRIREIHLGEDHLESARTYYCMGCALSDRGDFEEAIAELRRALRVRYQVFGPDHLDTVEVVDNIGIVLTAKGMDLQDIEEYKQLLPTILQTEMEGDEFQTKAQHEKDDKLRVEHFEVAMTNYKSALNLEQQLLGDLHPAVCNLHLKIADCLGNINRVEQSLDEYRSVIAIYEELLGKFHVKVAVIYGKLGTLLLTKGEYETALSFFAKSYGIYDSTLGNHPDTIQALMNVREAAEKERGAMNSMDILKRAERQKKEAVKIGVLRTQVPTPPTSPTKRRNRRRNRKSKGKNGGADDSADNDKKSGIGSAEITPVEVEDII